MRNQRSSSILDFRPITLAHDDTPPRVAKGVEEVDCQCSLIICEMAIARADRKAVGFTDSRHFHDLDGNIQVGDEVFDNRQLLSVFLSEVGIFGLDDLKQFQDDGRHSLKMSRSKSSTQMFREPAHVDGALGPLRIHFFR